MSLNKEQQNLLQKIPGVDQILELIIKTDLKDNPKNLITDSIRSVIDEIRENIIKKFETFSSETLSHENLINRVRDKIVREMTPNLVKTINGTGVVVHTNLGRSLLSKSAIEHINNIGDCYSNLELDLSTGKRGLRYSCVEDLICEISGAESSIVVNNNASAVLLALDTLAKEKEVIVSRGELVEIGGSFRIPDVMTKSGGILKEVGTTNRTHLKDYEGAISESTGLLLKVHTSNYSVVGFTASTSLKEMVDLGKKFSITVMEDLGSGTFVDFSKYGLHKEPTVQESVAAGVDVITFSGDKLLGGPQAGIIIGKKKIIDAIKKNPLTRALRIDKLTLAALEGTIRLYRDEKKAVREIPTLNMMTLPKKAIEEKAHKLLKMIKEINSSKLKVETMDISSKAGGGSLPLMELPSKCIGVTIDGIKSNFIEKFMRSYTPAIIGRIEDDIYIIDLRTVQENEFPIIKEAFNAMDIKVNL